MLKLHACKKCQGALILDKDEFGWYEECIQCGYSRDIPLDVPLDTPPAGDLIPVKVGIDPRKLVEKWKQDKMPAYQPIKSLAGREEDAY